MFGGKQGVGVGSGLGLHHFWEEERMGEPILFCCLDQDLWGGIGGIINKYGSGTLCLSTLSK